MNELSKDDLSSVSGGQYNPNAPYQESLVIRDGDIASIHSMFDIIGHIKVGEKVWLNMDYLYPVEGNDICVIRVDGPEGDDYVTKRSNIRAIFHN